MLVFYDECSLCKTNRGQLDGKLQIWKEIKAMWHPACHISCLFYWEEGGGSQWGGEATALQFYVGVPKREAKLEPVLCWGHTWNLSYFTPHTWPPSLFRAIQGNFMHSNNSKVILRGYDFTSNLTNKPFNPVGHFNLHRTNMCTQDIQTLICCREWTVSLVWFRLDPGNIFCCHYVP